MTNPTSEVRAFLGGDPAIVSEIHGAVRGAIRAFPDIDAGQAADLAQEVLGRLFLALRAGRFRAESSLKGYARGVAHRTCLEFLRRRGRFTDLESEPALPAPASSSPEARLVREEEHRRNLKLLAALSVECRDLFFLIFVERLAYREIAERLGISEQAVKLRVFRCRESTRRLRARDEKPEKPRHEPGHQEVEDE